MRKLICAALAVLLASLCACGQAVPGNAEPASSSAADTTLVEHTVIQRMHESFPEFTFKLLGNHGFFYTIDAIEITSSGFYQRLDGFETTWSVKLANYGLQFEDFNRDGFLDIQLLESAGGSLGNAPSYFWLWDDQQKQFISNAQLQEISSNSAIFMENQRLASSCNMKLDRWGVSTSYYKYEAGTFIRTDETRNFSAYENDILYNYHEILQAKNGEMKRISITREKVEGE